MKRTSGQKNPQWYGLYLGVILVVSGCLVVAMPLAAKEAEEEIAKQESKENVALSTTQQQSSVPGKSTTSSSSQNSFEKLV